MHPVVTCVVPGCIIGIETPDSHSNLNNWVLWGQNYPRSSGKIQVGAPQTALVVTVNQKRMACGRDAEHSATDETHGDACHAPSCSRVPALWKRGGSWILSRPPCLRPKRLCLRLGSLETSVDLVGVAVSELIREVQPELAVPQVDNSLHARVCPSV